MSHRVVLAGCFNLRSWPPKEAMVAVVSKDIVGDVSFWLPKCSCASKKRFEGSLVGRRTEERVLLRSQKVNRTKIVDARASYI